MIAIAHSCKKDGSGGRSLSGKWQLISTDGGIANIHRVYGPDSVYTLQLRIDNTYARAFNGQGYESGNYRITVARYSDQEDTSIFFIHGVDTTERQLETRNGDLYLGNHPEVDGLTDHYKNKP